MKTRLLIGTEIGLFLCSSGKRRDSKLRGPFLNRKEINHAVYSIAAAQFRALTDQAIHLNESIP